MCVCETLISFKTWNENLHANIQLLAEWDNSWPNLIAINVQGVELKIMPWPTIGPHTFQTRSIMKVVTLRSRCKYYIPHSLHILLCSHYSLRFVCKLISRPKEVCLQIEMTYDGKLSICSNVVCTKGKLLWTTWWLHSYKWKLYFSSWHAKNIYIIFIANIRKEVFNSWWNLVLKLKSNFITTRFERKINYNYCV